MDINVLIEVMHDAYMKVKQDKEALTKELSECQKTIVSLENQLKEATSTAPDEAEKATS